MRKILVRALWLCGAISPGSSQDIEREVAGRRADRRRALQARKSKCVAVDCMT